MFYKYFIFSIILLVGAEKPSVPVKIIEEYKKFNEPDLCIEDFLPKEIYVSNEAPAKIYGGLFIFKSNNEAIPFSLKEVNPESVEFFDLPEQSIEIEYGKSAKFLMVVSMHSLDKIKNINDIKNDLSFAYQEFGQEATEMTLFAQSDHGIRLSFISKKDDKYFSTVAAHFDARFKSQSAAIIDKKLHSNQLPKIEEINFIQERKKSSDKAFAKFIEQEVISDEIPSIAMIFSGGGFRAMTYTTGYLQGAHDINLLDCVHYMCGLSGSTWAIVPWLQSGLDIDNFRQNLKSAVKDGIDFSSWAGKLDAFRKWVGENPFKNYDFAYDLYAKHGFAFDYIFGRYGFCLATKLLSATSDFDKSIITFSSLKNQLQKNIARYPLPLCTAIHTRPGFEYSQAAFESPIWYEFSPFYTGTFQCGGLWMQASLLGSIFENGQVTKLCPELPLSYLMAIWGSAPAVSADEIKNYCAKNEWIESAINKVPINVISLFPFLRSEMISPHIPNPVYHFRQQLDTAASAIAGSSLPYKSEQQKACKYLDTDDKRFTLKDGGHDTIFSKVQKRQHNFADIPALYRNVDVLIFCDSNQDGADMGNHLYASADRAASLGLPFAQISGFGPAANEKLNNGQILIFGKEDLDAPLIIYMAAPNTANDPVTDTLNFKIPPAKFDQMTQSTQRIFKLNEKAIKVALQIASLKKKMKKMQVQKK